MQELYTISSVVSHRHPIRKVNVQVTIKYAAIFLQLAVVLWCQIESWRYHY